MGYLYKIVSKNDYSFFINPNYRQRGYGKKFVEELIKTDHSIQFSVSKHNTGTLNFFWTIEELYVPMKNTKSKTVYFQKNAMNYYPY